MEHQRVFSSSSHSFVLLFTFVVIDHCNYFGFGFTTLKRNENRSSTLFAISCILGCLTACLTNEASSTSQALPTSATGFPRMTAVPTPLLHPLPQPNPMASLPVSSPTVQPTRSIEQLLSISCSADVKMISPAHAQLLSATTLHNLQPTALSTSFESACYPVMEKHIRPVTN